MSLRTQTSFAFLSIVAVLGSIAAGGCPGSLDDPGKFLDGGSTTSGGCLDIEADLFQVEATSDVPGCAGTSCHGADQMLQVDLVSPGVKDRLVEPAVNTACAGTAIVADPSDPEGSLLYQKVERTQSCGSPMPLIGAELSEEQLKCLADYIGTLEGGGTPAGSGGSGTGGRATGGAATGGDGTGGAAGGT
jgi:hypothetical protein